MDLLLDTQVLVWIGTDDKRLSRTFRAALVARETVFYVSVVVACEFADLNRRRRFPGDLPLGDLLPLIGAQVLPFPAEGWRVLDTLPTLHRDPVDRMLVAHAIHADLTLVTADETIRRYPLATLW